MRASSSLLFDCVPHPCDVFNLVLLVDAGSAEPGGEEPRLFQTQHDARSVHMRNETDAGRPRSWSWGIEADMKAFCTVRRKGNTAHDVLDLVFPVGTSENEVWMRVRCPSRTQATARATRYDFSPK